MFVELKLISFWLFLTYASFYLIGITHRVADIKTRVQAMKCLSTYCEDVGLGFIFERVIPFPSAFICAWIRATGLFKVVYEASNPFL